jgi:outer membrane protein assembly factor BamB
MLKTGHGATIAAPTAYAELMLAAIASLLLVVTAQSEPEPRWPQFRGLDGASRAGATEALPSFDLDDDVRWRVDLPPGHSSPCVQGERIFLTGRDGGDLVMLAIDRKDGRELWRRAIEHAENPRFQHVDAALAMPTACTNGERVFFYFGSHGLVALDVDGKPVWEKRWPDPKAAFGLGASPVVFGDLVFLVRDGNPGPALHAFDEKTGEERWSVPRMDYFATHCTPFVWRNIERTELVVASSGRLEAYDPASGKSLWEVSGLTLLVCTSPAASDDTLFFAGWSTPGSAGQERMQSLFGDDIVFTDDELADPKATFARFDADADGRIVRDEFPPGRGRDSFAFVDRNNDDGVSLEEWSGVNAMPKRGENIAVAVKAGGDGDVTKTHVRWKHARGTPYVASPLLYEGRLWLAKAGGLITCLDAATGKPHFVQARLDDHSEYYASPLGVAGHVLVCASGGTIYLLRSADELEVAARVSLGERIHATPAIVGGTTYVRTAKALWAFGRPE